MATSNFPWTLYPSSMPYCRMQKRPRERIVIWRRRIGVVSGSLGGILFALAYLTYVRYFSGPTNLHVEEMRAHAHMLNVLWILSFYGGAFLSLLSLCGLGWSRWVGLVLNGGACLCALMTLGALCGPFGC